MTFELLPVDLERPSLFLVELGSSTSREVTFEEFAADFTVELFVAKMSSHVVVLDERHVDSREERTGELSPVASLYTRWTSPKGGGGEGRTIPSGF